MAYGTTAVKVRDPDFQVFVLFRARLVFAVTPTETITWNKPPSTECGRYLENNGDIHVRGSLCSNRQFIYGPPHVFINDVWMNTEVWSLLLWWIWRQVFEVHPRREDSPTMHTSQHAVWSYQGAALQHDWWYCSWFRLGRLLCTHGKVVGRQRIHHMELFLWEALSTVGNGMH